MAETDPDKRPLLDAEVMLLRAVFGGGIHYAPVRLVRLSPLVTSLNGSRAFVLANTLNLPSDAYDAILRGERLSLLVHEMTHVWQYQHGGWSYVAESLWAQSFGDGYDYAKALNAGKPWREMNPEQQASIIEDAYHGGYFSVRGARFGVVGSEGVVVHAGRTAPPSFTDHTDMLMAAVDALQLPA